MVSPDRVGATCFTPFHSRSVTFGTPVTPNLRDRPLDLFDVLRIGLERPLRSSEQPNAGARLSSEFDPRADKLNQTPEV